MSAIVYLVGAGPCAPDLITLRAARLIESADIDELARDGIAAGAGPTLLMFGEVFREALEAARQDEREFMREVVGHQRC